MHRQHTPDLSIPETFKDRARTCIVCTVMGVAMAAFLVINLS